jgi:membrane-associated phospholipid phosphatase/beta-phosphoglucomutase-like phosphatase (HAD superfamily)
VPAAERSPRVGRQRRPFLIAALAGLAVVVVVAVLMRSGALDGPDAGVAGLFAGRRAEPFTAVAEALDTLGTWWLLILLVAALVAGLWWSGRMLQALYLALSVVAAVVVNPVLKQVFQRPRPADDQLVAVSSTAFPSGHATTAATIATALAVIAWPTRWRWPVIAATAAFSLAMAVSRVYLGVHWPADVVGGLALGFTIAMTVRLLLPWPSPAEAAAARGESGAAGPAAAGAPGIEVVFLDWGNTLMVDSGMREGPMRDWDTVEAEAGAQEALLGLRGRYRLVVATNAEDSPAPDVRFALARVGLDEYVDDVITSADVGDHKPNYAFYRAALLHEGARGLPLDPRRAVMVGDGTTNDIAGAQRAGIRTVWYNPTKRRFPEGAPPPDAVIRKLADLPAAVDRLAGVKPQKRPRQRGAAEPDAAAAAGPPPAPPGPRAPTAAEDSAASAAAAIPDGR